MRSRLRRHLGLLDDPARTKPGLGFLLAAKDDGTPGVPPEFSPRQYAILLLHIAAGLEHALMVEYLYAAYSLGGSQVPMEQRMQVAQWQEVILGIAKEEMGHLMTVQNLLRALGGPLNLDREDYPWDSEFYPFPFRLEKVTLASLARYVVAEAPLTWEGPEAKKIRTLAKLGIGSAELHSVSELYKVIHDLIADPKALSDSDFRASTYPFQANWDEWGRGYKGGARGNATAGAMTGTPDVLLMPVAGRDDALAALDAVATQGEANPNADDTEPSHFARFLHIFRAFPKNGDWSPSRDIPDDPVVSSDLSDDGSPGGWGGTPIMHPEARGWAHLFNVRYQLLLTTLLHTFEYPSNLAESSQMTPRGLLVHATFGEMYNMRAISQVLVQTPLSEAGSGKMAGPPFQMPYTLNLPLDPVDRWQVHADLLRASRTLADALLKIAPAQHHIYLHALLEADESTTQMIAAILSGRSMAMPARRGHH